MYHLLFIGVFSGFWGRLGLQWSHGCLLVIFNSQSHLNPPEMQFTPAVDSIINDILIPPAVIQRRLRENVNFKLGQKPAKYPPRCKSWFTVFVQYQHVGISSLPIEIKPTVRQPQGFITWPIKSITKTWTFSPLMASLKWRPNVRINYDVNGLPLLLLPGWHATNIT